jgi:Zn-dependent protease
MDEHIRIGPVAGVPVGANWGVLLVGGLLAWSLAGMALPQLAPGFPGGAYWLVALATTVLFYQCLLAHELAHALVARRAGIGVDGIVLGLLGGVSRLEGQPPAAGVELRVAAAGPAASALLAGGFAAMGWIVHVAGGGALLGGALGWLGRINALLAAFNLLPAYPLDGGRVLRAALWGWHGDQARATVTADRVARLLASSLIAFGLVDAVLFGLPNALWLVVLGGFLGGAPKAQLLMSPGASPSPTARA